MPRKKIADETPVVPVDGAAAAPAAKTRAARARTTAVTHKHKKTTPAAETAPATQVDSHPVVSTPPSHEEIARLAYSYWESRGRHGGSAVQDWLHAEQELMRQRRLA